MHAGHVTSPDPKSSRRRGRAPAKLGRGHQDADEDDDEDEDGDEDGDEDEDAAAAADDDDDDDDHRTTTTTTTTTDDGRRRGRARASSSRMPKRPTTALLARLRMSRPSVRVRSRDTRMHAGHVPSPADEPPQRPKQPEVADAPIPQRAKEAAGTAARELALWP